MPTKSWRGKSAVFRMHSPLSGSDVPRLQQIHKSRQKAEESRTNLEYDISKCWRRLKTPFKEWTAIYILTESQFDLVVHVFQIITMIKTYSKNLSSARINLNDIRFKIALIYYRCLHLIHDSTN